jgi:SAM-dependent methyltransferase
MTTDASKADDWNGAAGLQFARQRERLGGILGRMRARLLVKAAIAGGEQVLDAGCGCGEMTIRAARAAGPGHALGADISRIQLAEARRLAAAAGVTNVSFLDADVAVHRFTPGTFDVVISSFGVMFFASPAAAFANLRRALRPGGRLAFACWRDRAVNPFFTTGFAAAAAELGLREMPGPDAAFSLADMSTTGALLDGAGFVGIEFTTADEPMLIGRDVDDVIGYERTEPSAQVALAGLTPAQARQVTDRVRAILLPYASADGVTMPGAAWLVTARAV